MAATSQYLTLGLAGETFGISIRNVREILDMRPISRLPRIRRAGRSIAGSRGRGSHLRAPCWRALGRTQYSTCSRPGG